MSDISLVGVNHQVAPVEVRERLAFGPERLPLILAGLQADLAARTGGDAPEIVVLSTCNRTELYVAAGEHAAVDVRSFLASRGGFPADALAPYLYVYRRHEAAHHLLRVAAGLDSLVIGENEILGQVKRAYEIAHAAGTTGPVLSALFRYAAQAGKRVRGETEIGRAALSVATIVVEMAQELLGPLTDRAALLIGAGKMGNIAGQALVRAGLRCVLVANRTFDRAERLAASLGGRAVHFEALAENLRGADIVICSTGAPHVVLHADAVAEVMTGRPDRPLLVTDLAVPRDADPAIAAIPGVRLADIDDLAALVRSHHPLAAAVRDAAEAIVEEELAGFRAWLAARCCVPVIQALRARAEAICEAETGRTLRRLGELSPDQQRAIAAMGRAIANKLLHDPLVNLKEPPPGLSPAEYAELVSTLFGLS